MGGGVAVSWFAAVPCSVVAWSVSVGSCVPAGVCVVLVWIVSAPLGAIMVVVVVRLNSVPCVLAWVSWFAAVACAACVLWVWSKVWVGCSCGVGILSPLCNFCVC